uniref:Domain of unknown function DB domain-containing protein n=1 Tax=Ditylenchus dipsaci TaxID=166011 RepID=A0A915EII5_9BILA
MPQYNYSVRIVAHCSHHHIDTYCLLKPNSVLWLLVLLSCFSECMSVPSFPEVVYPYKKTSTRSVLRTDTSVSVHSTTTALPFIERDIKKSNNVSRTRHSVSNTVNNFRVALHNRKQRIHAATQRRLNQASGSTNKDTSSTETAASSAEARVILAPIDGRRVYTADNYFLVSSERLDVDGEANPPRQTAKISSEVRMPVRSLDEKQKQETSGKASISELGPEEMQRTTMHELPSPITTTTPSSPRSTALSAKAHAALGKSAKTADHNSPASSVLQLVSHDTASGRPEQSIRFPAERWQLPPSLYSARLKSVDKLQALNPAQAKKINSNTTFYPSAQGKTYEEALAIYNKTQIPQNRAVQQNQPVVPLSSIRSPSLSQLSNPASGPLGRPNLSLTGGGVQLAKKGLRVKFASRHSDYQNKPIALPASTDDSDFDLLSAQRTRPAINTFIPLPIAGNGNTFIAETIPLPIKPAEVNSAPYVARLNPNEKLDLCCKKQSVSNLCQGLCNFDTFTDRSLVSALLSNQCPGSQLGQAFDCATSKVDHSECCRRYNVHLHNGVNACPFARRIYLHLLMFSAI